MTDGRLVVPEGLVIDEVARVRLEHQLARLPAEIKAVAAEAAALPSGSSYRVEAEWRSLVPTADLVEAGGPVRGAVLVRPNVRYEVSDGLVGVDGPVRVDPGAHVHDPRVALGTLRPASVEGRPPFPRRPVVVFAATGPECDPETVDWARRMVNLLVRRDVEGRLALPATDEFATALAGLHLTRPCRVGPESIAALAPDVIVTLDAGAAAQAAAWCGSDRATVVVELIDDLSVTHRLVSWKIERARGRVRAEIGRRVGAPALATLVRRLSAGPQPIAPTDDAAEAAATQPAVRENWGSGARTRPTCVVVTGREPGAATRRRWDGLADHFEAAGVGVVTVPVDAGIPRGAHSAGLVVLVGVDPSAALTELVEARTAQRLPTIVDIDPTDLQPAATGSTAAVALRAGVAPIAALCGNVLTPTDATRGAVDPKRVRTCVVPAMLTRERASWLRNADAAARTTDPAERARAGLTIGWYAGEGDAPAPGYLDAVAEGISKLLADRADVHVEVVGDDERVPAALARNDRVTVSPTVPEPEAIARWALHLWTPRVEAGEVVDDLVWLVQAGSAGVPSVLPKPGARALDGTAANDQLVSRFEEPEGWAAAARRLLDDDAKRAHLAYESRRWARSVHGAPACRASVNRLLGWAKFGAAR